MADNPGDWMFHCHILYHMMAGMTRIFSNSPHGANHQAHLGEHRVRALNTAAILRAIGVA